MSLNESGNGSMVMPVGPMYGNANGFGGFADGGLFWIIILFLFAWMGNGWGGYGGGQQPVVNTVANDVQRGFDQSAIMNSFSNLNNAMYNAEVSRANNANSMAMALQNCCCENRAGIADLKYTIATEACADRQSVNDALRDLETSPSGKTQMILDKLCQQEIDALKTQNANLQTQINLANLKASQSDQTAQVIADNAAQTAILRQALNPTPIPAYVVQNPNFGCGC
jgi:hypothetical protein